MLARAREHAAEAGVELELREADMRDLDLVEATDLVICPYRALLHLPTWADRRRVFERVARALVPGRALRLERIRLRPPLRDGARRQVAGRAEAPPDRVCARRQPRRHHARGRADALAVVGRSLRVGSSARRRRPRDRGALRLVRPPPVRRYEPRVRLGCAQEAVTGLYDGSRRSTTRGAVPSPRTSASTSTRRSRPVARWSSSQSEPAASRSRSPERAST